MTPQQYNEAVQEGVVLVDFYSDGCGPCRILAPILQELVNVDVVKINVSDFPELASQHNISAVPTLKFYKNGQLHDTILGLQTKDKLQSKIDALNEG